jgi:hypothetical protein
MIDNPSLWGPSVAPTVLGCPANSVDVATWTRHDRTHPRERFRLVGRHPHDQPIAVVLDFVHPIRASRRLVSNGWDARGNKSVSADEGSGHAVEIAACCEPPQPSSCRGASRIVTSETPKTNGMAKLTTHTTAKGMFSRHRTSPPQESGTAR